LRRCLERDRKRRLPDIGVALLEIDEARAEPEAPAVTASPKPTLRLFPWIAATVLLALTQPAIWLLRRQPEERMLQFEVSAPPGYTFGTSNIYRYAISPDGSKLAFIATSADGKRSLWVRPLDASAVIRLPGTEGAIGPFLGPNQPVGCVWSKREGAEDRCQRRPTASALRCISDNCSRGPGTAMV
jgi:hypothetical protein